MAEASSSIGWAFYWGIGRSRLSATVMSWHGRL